MKIRLDDVANCIEYGEDDSWEEVQFDHHYSNDYNKVVELLLTPAQLNKYYGIDTARTFTISAKKEAVLKSYIFP